MLEERGVGGYEGCEGADGVGGVVVVGDWFEEDVGEVFEAIGCCYVLWGWLVGGA